MVGLRTQKNSSQSNTNVSSLVTKRFIAVGEILRITIGVHGYFIFGPTLISLRLAPGGRQVHRSGNGAGYDHEGVEIIHI